MTKAFLRIIISRIKILTILILFPLRNKAKLLLLVTCYLLLVTNYLSLVTPSPAFAVPLPCTPSTLNQGLISAESITGASFGNTDQTCVVDPQAYYRDFNVPSYEELENQFYSLSRSSAKKSAPLLNGELNFNGDGIYLQPTASMNISKATGSGVQIIFIRQNLYITGNITYGETGNPAVDSYSGLVFIVKGNINIDYNVTKVNAVLISGGEICTAYDSGNSACLTGSGLPYTPQLTVNGSLISLNKTNLPDKISAIKLTRNLANNTEAAEVINKQAKYLYILKNGLLTKDLVLTQEDRTYIIPSPPSGTPTPTPTPTPGPSACLGGNPLVIDASPMPAIASCVVGI